MAAPISDVFEHAGPWMEEEFLALPVDRRLELLDGALLVSPSARARYQRLSFRLAAALGAAVPPGLEVLEAVNVRVRPGKILIPDLAVLTVPGLDRAVCDVTDVVLVVEITGPGNAAVDCAVKPQLYAHAGVPHYLRIELGEECPRALVYRLRGQRYAQVACVGPGQPLALTEPITVTLDLAALAATTRPPPAEHGGR